jgi:hypothetical protein
MRYSPDLAQDALISRLMDTYSGGPVPREVCVEREWSSDGEFQLSARPYSRVRCVKVYNSVEWLKAGSPKDLAPFEAGIRMERW